MARPGAFPRAFANNDSAERVQQSGTPAFQDANDALAVIVGASVELAQGRIIRRIWLVLRNWGPPLALTHTINILLDRPDIAKTLVAIDKTDVLEGYVAEMLRVDAPVRRIYRKAKPSITVGSISVNVGDLICLGVASANLDVSFEASRCLDCISQPV